MKKFTVIIFSLLFIFPALGSEIVSTTSGDVKGIVKKR